EPQEAFMHQGGGVQVGCGMVSMQTRTRNLSQFGIKRLEHLLECALLAAGSLGKQVGERSFAWRHSRRAGLRGIRVSNTPASLTLPRAAVTHFTCGIASTR